MANRFPLIFNSGAGQIQELAASDNLDLTSSNLVNAGILFTSSGSATAPSISIGSGTTYPPGLYSPGTDQLSISTGGAGRLFISSTGLVGIGDSSPSTLLHLSGLNSGGGSANTIRVTDTDTAVITDQICGRIEFETADTGNPGVNCQIDALYSGSGGGSKLQFRTGFAGALVDALHISDTGKVGISTTSPSNTLEISKEANHGITLTRPAGGVNPGSFKLEVSSFGAGTLTADNNLSLTTGSSQQLIVNRGATESFRVDANSRLLVGTPTARSSGGHTGSFQLEGTTFATSTAAITANSSNGNGAYLNFGKARGGSIGSTTIVQSGDVLGQIQFNGADGTSLQNAAFITAIVDGTPGANDMPGRIVLSTTVAGAATPTERMTITNLGQILVGKTTAAISTVGIILGTTGDLYGSISSGNTLHVYSTTASAYRFYVNENGGISNYSGNNINLSDEREKKNIEALDSTWDCLKAWGLKKFHYNEDADADGKRYGVIAQQVAPHCPEIISQWIKQPAQSAKLDEDGNVVTPAVEEVTRMGVKEQQMMWMAIKALQEAQTRIETLETEVAALKGA
jgi:hypothetical protein